MKKTWYIFKEYYLDFLLIYFIVITVVYFSHNYPEDTERVKFLLIFGAIFILCIGSLEFLSHTYYRPWKIRKMLNSSPFVEFRRKGFINDDDNDLKGSLRGYNLFIGILWENHQKQPSYFVQIIFNPFFNERFLREDEYEKFEESLFEKNKTFTTNSLIIINNRYKGFKKTKYKGIMKDIFEAIDFLKSRKLEPISFEDWFEHEQFENKN